MAADPRRGPTSFRDPTYDALDRSVEDRLKLPPGMLAGIRTRGERSNSDQVSSAGARTVYQVTPTTRDLVMNKYGVDAYAGPQQAALAAGYLLREGLDRNRGSQRAAIAEYHGGTNRRNHGPITQAYVARVAGGDGTSTYDRARAKQVAAREEQSGPSLAKVYAAYRQGRMSTEQAAQFEHDVNAGAILLPPGGKLKRTPAAPQLPAGVIRAYNNMESGMTVEQRQQIDRDMQDGIVSLPRAAKLNTWRPMTTAENLMRSAGVGARAVIEGAGDVAGIVMNPVNSMLNATGLPQTATGQALPMANDPSVNVADKLGLPKAQFDGEKMLSSVERGAAGSLFSAGAGGIVKSLPGVAGAVGRAMAASPAADAVAGGVSGGSAEAARQEGLGPTGQFVAGLAGGGIGLIGAASAQRAVARTGRGRATVDLPATAPREAIVNEAGDLTEDGQELVARHGFTPDEIKQAYANPEPSTPAPVGTSPAPVAPNIAAAEERVRQAQGAVGRAGGRVELQNGETITLDASRPSRVDPEALAKAEAELAAARSELSIARASADVPPPATAGAEGTPPLPLADSQPIPTPSAAPRTPLIGAVGSVDEAAPPPLPASRTAADRTREAEALNIPLTRGQATQDFAIQDTEQTLRAQASGEGEKARAFLVDQADKIGTAVTRFREAFGATDITKAERGRVVVDALRDLRNQGKAGINALYREANEMGGGGLSLDTAGIADAAKRVLVEADVPDGVKNVVRQEMARYGLIGKNPITAEDGLTTVSLTDGRKVQFYGDPEQLTVGNAEQFRKAISAQYPIDGPRKLSQGIKGAVDDAVETAVEGAAKNGVDGPVAAKLREARQAVVTQKETFAAKDVVQKLVDWKKGTRTDNVLPENAIREVLSGEVSNLRRIKAVLLSRPTPTSKGAWRAIQAEGIGGIIDKAYTVNSNLGGGPVATISGAKLNSEITRFGIAKLKTLLDEPDFARLMSLRRVIGEATIPISGTTNPSGSAFKMMRFLAPMATKFASIPLAGPAIDVVSGFVKQAKATAEANRTLTGMTTYDTGKAVQEAARASKAQVPVEIGKQAKEFLDALTEAARSGRLSAAALSAALATHPEPRSNNYR